MVIKTVWTINEGTNVLYVLRRLYGDRQDGSLVKEAVRELVELKRLEHLKNKNKRSQR